MSGITVRHASGAERARWDELVGENPSGGDFVMAQPYAETKAAFGWIPRHLVFERDGERVSVALVMERRIALLGRYWYLPHGPAVADPGAAHEHIVALLDFVRAHEPRVFSVTVEPQLERTEQNLAATTSGEHSLSALGAVWRPGIHAGTSTAIVKIDADDEALLASFHKRCRNMISRARRDGIEVREYPATPETFAQMHRLMRLVGGGKADLRLRSNDYAERFWRGFSDAGLGRFYGIEVDGSPALLAFVIRVGTHAFYKDGGSERPRTTPGMSNYLQWHMMRQMRDAGATQYDMIGVPPKDRLDDPTARDYSLAPFKLSFAREVTEFIGGYDFGVKSRAFRIWQRIGLPVMQRWYRLRYRDLAFY